MMLTAYIAELQDILDHVGNLPVVISGYDDTEMARGPEVIVDTTVYTDKDGYVEIKECVDLR